MKRQTIIILVIGFIAVLVIASVLGIMYYVWIHTPDEYSMNETFTVANWNLQIFGDAKASRPELMDMYAQIIARFDIVIIQEIRDKDGSSFRQLCAKLAQYGCVNSSRAGRSSSKEQYGIIYLKNYSILEVEDFNPDVQDRWERPPLRATFKLDNYSITLYTDHTKPDDTPREMAALQSVVHDAGNVILLGDLNADCNYYDVTRKHFSTWHWIVRDDDDTTTSPSNCAYDRIIMNADAYHELLDYGIFREDIDESVSDHYLVWVRVRNHDYIRDTSFNTFVREKIL